MGLDDAGQAGSAQGAAGAARPLVAFDATAIPNDRSGVGRYVEEVLRALDATGHAVTIICQESDVERFTRLCPSSPIIGIPGIRGRLKRLTWEQLGLSRRARKAGARLIHSPHYTVPVFTRRRRVVTFHDATFFSQPEAHTRFKRVFFPAWIRLSRRLADRVLVVSAATASELDRYVRPLPQHPYTVVRLGVDHDRFRPSDPAVIEEMRQRLGLPERWIAFLGTIEPRKNVPALIDAYAASARRWRGDPEAFPALALAGADGWEQDITPHIERVPAPGRVMRLGYLDLDDLAPYLGGSQFVVYPSIAEGFGLPVIEAMACGAAVLTTPRLSIPEVAGDAAHYTEPDADSISWAIDTLLADDELRADLGRRGLERAAGFTWAACADGHRAVWDEVLRAHRRDVDRELA